MSLLNLGCILLLSILLGCSTSNLFLVICMMELSMYTFLFMNYEYKLLGLVASCIKYFFVQSVGSVFLFLGSVAVLLHFPTWLNSLLFLLGFFLKLGAFPMFFWVIPVNSALSYGMIGVLSSPMKILPVALMIQYFLTFLAEVNSYVNIVIFSGVFSMVVGMFLGFASKTLRSMLGASSIAHTGWLLISMPISCTWYYFTLYSLGVVTFFASLISCTNIYSSVGLLCLGGLPPFGIFAAKLCVIMSLYSSSMSGVLLLVILITSALSLFYYMKYSFIYFLLPSLSRPLSWPVVVLFTLNIFSSCLLFAFFYSLVWAAAF